MAQPPDLTVYAVDFDLLRYRSLLFDVASDEEFAAIPGFGGRVPLSGGWQAPRVLITDEVIEGFPRKSDPDIWHLFSSGETLVMSAPVVDQLEPFLSQSGELLPLESPPGDDRTFHALNVLNQIPVDECIDVALRGDERLRRLVEMRDEAPVELLQQVDYEALLQAATDGDPWPVLYPDFVAERLAFAPGFFRIDRLPSIFLLDHDADEDTPLRRIDLLNLRGLVLTKAWSSATGPEAINFFER